VLQTEREFRIGPGPNIINVDKLDIRCNKFGGTRPSPYIRVVLLGEALHVNLTVLLLLFTASRWKDLVVMPSLLFSPTWPLGWS